MNNLVLLSFLCLCPYRSFGQMDRLNEHNSVGWYTYNGDHKFAKRWALHTEYQWRRIDFIRTWQQSLARLGVIHKLTDRVQVSGGYTLFVTYPYGSYTADQVDAPVPEHRIYEDIQLSDQFGHLKLTHRFRLEQRWIAQPADDNPRHITDWSYQNRVRYQVAGTFPLSGASIDDGEFYLNAFDELFIGFGPNVGANIYNQNRISGGIGYQFKDNFKIELNYFNRILQHDELDPATAKAVFDYDNGFRLNVNYDLDFRRNK